MADENNIKVAPLGGLARKLIQIGLLSEELALSISEQALKEAKPFISCLIENGTLNPTDLAIRCSQEFGIPVLNLDAFEQQNIPRDLLNSTLIVQYHALPIFKRGDRLFIAISDPANLKAVDEIKYKTNMYTEAVLVEEHKLSAAITKIIANLEAASLGALDANLEEVDFFNEEEAREAAAKIASGDSTEDAPIIRFVNKVILEAVNMGASDLHFEPYENSYRIRFRHDGILYEHATPPSNTADRLAARLKVMARLNISERRIPQDGRFKMRLSSARSIDFRVASCPTLYGEKIVMRILDPTSAKIGVDALGFEPFQKELFLKAIERPQGMILVTGPTGSGKTISLYTAVNILNTSERNISTCEDPVEINLPGVNQVSLNLKAGLTFAVALRAFLRQDPDIIMVGEIRDLETAEIAVKAAQTGHMVLSTLHTNSAADTIIRMVNMGVPAYNLATSISLVVAQRLARLLCPDCKKPLELPKNILLEHGFSEEEISSLQLFEPVGCEKCKNGYKGRIGIYEIMPISTAISTLVLAGGNPITIHQKALDEGMWSLRRAGLEKVKKGLTTLDELFRIMKE
ncbi:MAG: type IV-A pilus assembly ATPase PilB [Gammaproteobacteria bacterium]|nr:type IV-A pilus assembly ATPase PilB [Gammaproteobacteria bacterium]MBP9729499.1 type IV-A pilus assembly ATPase PilB [Gammaproteobacteria bacterium]